MGRPFRAVPADARRWLHHPCRADARNHQHRHRNLRGGGRATAVACVVVARSTRAAGRGIAQNGSPRRRAARLGGRTRRRRRSAGPWIGPPGEWRGGRRDPGTEGHAAGRGTRRGTGVTCCCRHSLRFRIAWAGSAGRHSTGLPAAHRSASGGIRSGEPPRIGRSGAVRGPTRRPLDVRRGGHRPTDSPPKGIARRSGPTAGHPISPPRGER
jgi:hypothetical protein